MTNKTRLMLGTMLAGSVALTAPVALASSHREAPAIAGMPRVDGTDFYMFRSYEPGRQDFVTLIANYIPLQAPYGGPNYFTLDNDAIYEIHIDNTGNAMEDITFQFDFSTALSNSGQGAELDIGDQKVAIPLRQSGQIRSPGDANINETESFTVTMISGNRRSGARAPVTRSGGGGGAVFAKPVDNIGQKTLPEYAAYANAHIHNVVIPGCATPGKVFVGQREEAFAVNLGGIFDLVSFVPLQGPVPNANYPDYTVTNPFPGGIMQDRANDDLIGKHNVTSIAMEVPIACLTGAGNGVIGGWTTASLPQAQLRDPSPTYNGTTRQGGAYVQVSRLSNPLVNEVVIGLRDKDLFNAAKPTQDGALATYVTHPTLPALLDLLFRDAVGSPSNIAPSNLPRNDLVAAFLTGFPGVNQQATVTGSEMIRLNTGIPAKPWNQQHTFGVIGGDLAGFPNGRRPADDTVDIALRVMMGRLCHDLPLGEGGAGVNLDICSPEDAPVGDQPFTDGAPLKATELLNAFPYLNTPIPGSVNPN
ncbi:MAG: DUF4331 domain-containing protein [Gemmobacter sp.]